MDSVARAQSGAQQLCLPKSVLRWPLPRGEAALIYARLGWYVFPLQAFAKRPRRRSHGLLDATLDEAQVRAWWADDPAANVGVDCGRSGLLVIDVDPRNNGDLMLAEWERSHGQLPATLMARTPSGGLHYYYATPIERRVRKGILCKGVDIQAMGGYVVAPPSETLEGEYRWIVETA